MKNNFKRYVLGTLSVSVASSLLTTKVLAEETIVESPVVEQIVVQTTVAQTATPVPQETTAALVATTVFERGTEETTVTPVPEHELDMTPQRQLTPEENAYINNYLQELSKAAGGNPVGLMPNEVEALLKKMKEDKNRQVQQQPSLITTTKSQQITSDNKNNDNLEHSVVENKEIEKDIYSVKFVTLDKKNGKKKVHDFKEKDEKKSKDKDKVDYSKEPARVGTTPGAAYAIVELEDGIYGQLVVDRKSGKKLITVKYDLLKETIEKGSWEYKDEEVVEVKKEDKSPEQTTTTKSR